MNKKNCRSIILLIAWLLAAAQSFAQDSTYCSDASNAPIIEHRPDRVNIFPQRMPLDDNTTVMDVLMMLPEALSRNYEDIDDKYVVRVENFNYEADIRIFLSTLKAKYVEKIQICDNPDVMKGSKNLGGEIDINMIRGAQTEDIYIGTEIDTKGLRHAPVFNAIYGNGKTDVLVTASLQDDSRKGEYDETARCAAKINSALNERHNLMYDFAARYSHSSLDGCTDSRYYGGQIQYDGIFNEAGTMLTVSADVEYYDDGFSSPKYQPLPNTERNREVWQVYNVEFYSPIAKGLELCAGWEGDYANTSLRLSQMLNLDDNEKKSISSAFMLSKLPTDFNVKDHINTYNNDFYAQLDYTAGPLTLTLGDRVMYFHYGYSNDINAHRENNNHPYNLVVASAILNTNIHQVQAAYYRRFVTPDSYDTHNYLHFDTDGRSITTGNPDLDYQPADVYRLAYTLNTKPLCVSMIIRNMQTHNIIIDTDGIFNGIPVATFANDKTSCSITDYNASISLNKRHFNLSCGGNICQKHVTGEKDHTYGYARIAPTFYLDGGWKIGAQAVWCSNKTIEKSITNTNTYGMLAVQKDFGKHLTISAQWHDMFSKDLSTVNFRLLYYFVRDHKKRNE